MLRMTPFELVAARSPDEALELHAAVPGALYVAGGTDLLPNIKQGLFAPPRVVNLAGALPVGLREEPDQIVIGAGTRLSQLARTTALPALAAAAGLVAGPQIRNMGTIGGNILLDTRCLFYNQTAHWRASLGHCLKAEGTWCHVVGGPKTCVATQSSDTVPVLLTLDARIRLRGPQGERLLPLRELYAFNGMKHLKIEPGELLTAVEIPRPAPGTVGAYSKLRTRDAIDFPQLGLAVSLRQEDGAIAALDIVVGAINPQPKLVPGLDAFVGRVLDEGAIEEIAELVFQRSRPQGSVVGDVAWRRQMARVYTRRALRQLGGLRDTEGAAA